MSVDPPEGARLVVGRYRLGELLGKGGMGTVWRATDELLGREVALKRLRLADLPDDEATLARERTMREARIAASLHHPQIVSIFDVVVEDAEPWLVLEYLPSVSLGRMLRDRGPLPVADVAAIGAQMADALAAAHSAGIVHRDVKPDNVLVAGPTAKLTDFGISYAATAPTITQTGVLTGTPAYLAPETCRGEGTDARSDVYALGATLYAAVEGVPPFGTGGDLLALIARIAYGQAPPPRRAGPLTDVLRAMLVDDPRARPTAGQVRDAIGGSARAATDSVRTHLVAGPTVRHAPPPTTPRAPTPRSRRTLVIALGAVAGVAALAVATVVGLTVLRGAGTATPPAVNSAAATLGDPRTADPCSLVDTATLGRHGTVTIDRANVSFTGCRAQIAPPGGGELALFVEFALPPASTDTVGAPQQIGRLIVNRLTPTDTVCERNLLLPDGNIVAVYAQRLDAGTGDLCAIADTGAAAATAILNSRGTAAREPLDVTNPLAGIDACDLLDAADLRAVPGTSGVGAPGFGNWSCSWGRADELSVYVNYFRGPPPDPDRVTTVTIAGRTAATAPDVGRCRIELVQRQYPTDLGERADIVQLTVYGSATDDDTCRQATALATAVAATLPT